MATARKQKGAVPPSTADRRAQKKLDLAQQRIARRAAWYENKRKAMIAVKKEVVVPLTAKKDGHPTVWTKSIEEKFEREVTLGTPVKEIGRMSDMPNEYSLWTWIAKEDHPCASAYARGKQKRVANLEEELEIESNANRTGVVTTKKEVVTGDGDVIEVEESRQYDNTERSKIRIDAIKWTLAHTRPKKHGRQPELPADKGNTQLDSLFKSLMSGPASTDGAGEEDE